MSTRTRGEFARVLWSEEIVFLIIEREENFQQEIILVLGDGKIIIYLRDVLAE